MQFPNNQSNNQPENERPPQPPWRNWIVPAVLLLIIAWTIFRVPDMFGAGSAGQSIEIPYSTFYEQVTAQNVSQVLIQENTVQGQFRNPVQWPPDAEGAPEYARFTTTLLPSVLEDSQLANALRENNVTIVARTVDTSPILLFLLNFGPILLLLGFFLWSTRRAQGQLTGAFGFGRTRAREYSAEKPHITFDDVAGQDAAKAELVEIVDFLREPDKYIALGARIPRGVLLIGPPGTGKTLMARAVAGEANVAFFSLSASEFVEMFVGVGASRVRDLFNRAKAAAPSIVFIDEIDAVGRRRGAGLGGGNDEREQTLNQMLAEMDGFDQRESVIVMAATNRPDVLDPALLRPGRFDRQVTIGLPDRAGRLSILKIHTRGKPLAEDVDLEAIAKATIGFSGADIANLANEAALQAARKNHKRITERDFSDAFDRIVLGTESPPLSNPEERRVVAFHEAGHALVAAVTPGADPIYKVSIVPRGQGLGVAVQLPTDDRRNYSRQYLLARMLVALGGRAAEQTVFNEITTGAESDLKFVTTLARRMVAQFGMSEAIGPLNFGEHETQPFLGYSLTQERSYSEETAARIDAEVKRIVEEAYDQTLKLIEYHRDQLNQLAEELMTHEVVAGERLKAILELHGREDEEEESMAEKANLI